MNLDQRYKRATHCLVEDMHGDLLVFNPENVVTVHLNGSSSIVWELCDGTDTVGEMIQILKAAYPSQADRITKDVISAIRSLEQSELIKKVVF